MLSARKSVIPCDLGGETRNEAFASPVFPQKDAWFHCPDHSRKHEMLLSFSSRNFHVACLGNLASQHHICNPRLAIRHNQCRLKNEIVFLFANVSINLHLHVTTKVRELF